MESPTQDRSWRKVSVEDFGLTEEPEIEKFEEIYVPEDSPRGKSWRQTSYEDFFDDDELADDDDSEIEEQLTLATKDLVDHITLHTSSDEVPIQTNATANEKLKIEPNAISDVVKPPAVPLQSAPFKITLTTNTREVSKEMNVIASIKWSAFIQFAKKLIDPLGYSFIANETVHAFSLDGKLLESISEISPGINSIICLNIKGIQLFLHTIS